MLCVRERKEVVEGGVKWEVTSQSRKEGAFIQMFMKFERNSLQMAFMFHSYVYIVINIVGTVLTTILATFPHTIQSLQSPFDP